MTTTIRRTKIVATLGPATESPESLRSLVQAGMNVARLNFSHGRHEDHARMVALLRQVSRELDNPVTILQDLQGPKIRVGRLPDDGLDLAPGERVTLLPEADYTGEPGVIPMDYPHLAEEARPGLQILLADGALELRIESLAGRSVICRVVEGGRLTSRKGINVPALALRLPSLTDKDLSDLAFGLAQGVDVVSLSFVRCADDVRALKDLICRRGSDTSVVAKIEKPQAIEDLEAIVAAADGIMVARGDLGVEMSPERVPMLQKRIIELCNRQGRPVITATQMLESMIREPRPTRAEASDVANAILDGTDAVMLSGETAVGVHPTRAVAMMDRIAREVESGMAFRSYPPAGDTDTHALGEAVTVMDQALRPACIAVLTVNGHTARWVAAARPRAPVAALTNNPRVYHALNLLWGIAPLLVERTETTFEGLLDLADTTLRARGLAGAGDRILVIGGESASRPQGSNFIKIHTLA
jgi:pyruvate kinase